MLFETPLRFLDDVSHGFLKEGAVGFVEGGKIGAVDVKNCADLALCIVNGNDDFTVRQRRAGNVSRKLVDVGHNQRAAFLPCRSADATSPCNARASDGPLEWTEYKLITDDTVESGPEEMHRFVEQGAEIGHAADGVWLVGHEGAQLGQKRSVLFSLCHVTECFL